MSLPKIPNAYPVELAAPDISAYAKGTDGVPYVLSFTAREPGPHTMIAAVVHGNEPCGAIALDWLLGRDFRPARGRLTLAFVNIEAYEAFDPADPNASRWVEEDFNRVWDAATLDGPGDSVELRRAREIRPVLAGVDLLLDIHSMQHVAPPLALSGWCAKGAALAGRIGVPEKVVADRGHAAGRRMRDYGAFADPQAHAASVLIECGQHWELAAATLAKVAAARFLVSAGQADGGLIGEAGGSAAPPPQAFFEVTEAVTIQTEAFRFARDFTGGEVLPEAGTLIGHDGDAEVRTPYADCMLVMPSKRLWPGQTAVRLARAAEAPA